MWRYWVKTPHKSQICFMDRSWYQDIAYLYESQRTLTNRLLRAKIKSAARFERMLASDGTLIIKIYLHISKKEQKRRLEGLSRKKSTAWRVTKKDWVRNKNYDQNMKIADIMLKNTNHPFAPWHVIDGTHKRNRNLAIYQTIVSSVKKVLDDKLESVKIGASSRIEAERFNLLKMPAIQNIDLSRSVSRYVYDKQVK